MPPCCIRSSIIVTIIINYNFQLFFYRLSVFSSYGCHGSYVCKGQVKTYRSKPSEVDIQIEEVQNSESDRQEVYQQMFLISVKQLLYLYILLNFLILITKCIKYSLMQHVFHVVTYSHIYIYKHQIKLITMQLIL